MLKKQLLFAGSLLVFISCILPFIMGAEILLYHVIEQPYFPFGNLVAAIGLVSFPLLFKFGLKSLYYPVGKLERFFAKLYLVFTFFSLLWIPVGYLLSGNLSNTFSDASSFQGSALATQLFWIYTYSLILFPLLGALLLWVLGFFPKKRSSPKDEILDPKEVLYILKGIAQGLLNFNILPGNYWAGRMTVTFEIECKGYLIDFFIDAGELDYLTKVKAPDGKIGGYDLWDNQGLLDPIEYLTYREERAIIAQFESK